MRIITNLPRVVCRLGVLLPLLPFSLLLASCIQTGRLHVEQLAPQLMPSAAGRDIQLVRHQNYLLGYDERAEQAAWVLYELLASELEGPRQERSNNFREDPQVATGSASLKDYRKSGYDRGHLAPAADMAFSPEAMSESFYLSNMSPQEPGFNRGIWGKLESLIRIWALRYQRIVVVTAGIVLGEQARQLTAIGENQVWVPRYYYKIVYNPQRRQMLAFVLPNRAYTFKEHEDFSVFAVSVDRAEELSRLDFFPQLPDGAEESMESESDFSSWDFAAQY